MAQAYSLFSSLSPKPTSIAREFRFFLSYLAGFLFLIASETDGVMRSRTSQVLVSEVETVGRLSFLRTCQTPVHLGQIQVRTTWDQTDHFPSSYYLFLLRPKPVVDIFSCLSSFAGPPPTKKTPISPFGGLTWSAPEGFTRNVSCRPPLLCPRLISENRHALLSSRVTHLLSWILLKSQIPYRSPPSTFQPPDYNPFSPDVISPPDVRETFPRLFPRSFFLFPFTRCARRHLI